MNQSPTSHHPSRRRRPLPPSLALPALAALILTAALPELASPARPSDRGPRSRVSSAGSPALAVRGVTISTHIDGSDWGSDAMVSTMEDIQAVGATWVATHPYAGIRQDGTVRFHRFDPESPPAWLVRPIREAHALGLRILIKPHLAYWGSPFRWRGEIEFETDEQWTRFFRSYERWLVGLATACRDADGLVIGTELDLTVRFEEAWRRIIAAVRERTGLALTYAANWDSYEQVPFWDALDVIGIQAYFPVTVEEDPGQAAIKEGWSARMAELRRFAGDRGRPIVFTELGYNRSFAAPVRPWESRADGTEAEALQAACLRIALQAIEEEPSVIGAFLWKWFPNPYPLGRNFQLATPRLKSTIAEVWLEGG